MKKMISRRDFLKLTGITAGALVLAACSPQIAQFIYPLHDAVQVSPKATMIVRYGPTLSSLDAASLTFTVKGTKSGLHTGQTILADDRQTVIFKPALPFTPGERVSVQVTSLQVNLGTSFSPISTSFSIATNMQPGSPLSANPPPLPSAPKSAFPNYLTLPQDIPHYNVTHLTNLPGEGYIFVAPFYWTSSTVGSYLLILDDMGEIVYHQSMSRQLAAFDFKVLPNGLLSYFSQQDSTFYLMDSHYQVVGTYQAGDGYTADLHDFLLLPNGNVVLMVYDNQTIDMSKIVPGGQSNATVTGLVIQEMDPSKNVIWEWRSWDHFAFLDSTADLTQPQIDLIHGNALALTNDGNLLLSSRNLCEITKINLQSGEIMWRLGGKANQFKFTNDEMFDYQHHVYQLPNGDITVFDNHGTQEAPAPSRALEYRVDDVNKTATKVWSYINNPPVFATYMGDNQRLPDGNIFLDWGAPSSAAGYAYISMTEIDPDGKVLFEIDFDSPYVSYRAFKTPWEGSPASVPTIAYKKDNTGLTLGYSWNGATKVYSWQVFGGSDPLELGFIDKVAKGGFETQSHFATLPQDQNFFQVAALDIDGNVLAQSKVLSIT